MKRRRALKVLGGAVGLPLVLPPGLDQLIAWGSEVRRGIADTTRAARDGLTDAQLRLVNALSDVIIPETDTPGASGAGVGTFVDSLVSGWLDDADRDRFLTGLDTVDPLSRQTHGADFADLDPDRQSELVHRFDEEVERLRRAPDGDETEHFFYDVKRFALAGYFTSEEGLKTLGYRIIPGAFEGCVLIDQYGTGGR